MDLFYAFQAFYIKYNNLIKKTGNTVLSELNGYLSNKSYVKELKLDEIQFQFINTALYKCRVRPSYHAVRDMAKDPDEPFSRMALIYEIPLPESEFIQVPEEDLPTYIGKAILKVIEEQNVPVKIRKQFDKDRFVADVRSFFVNVKGCEL